MPTAAPVSFHAVWQSRVIEILRQGSRVTRFGTNVSSQTVADPGFPAFVADELRRTAPRDVIRTTSHAAKLAIRERTFAAAQTLPGRYGDIHPLGGHMFATACAERPN